MNYERLDLETLREYCDVHTRVYIIAVENQIGLSLDEICIIRNLAM